MPVSLHVRREGSALVPVNAENQQILESLPEHKPLRAKVSKPRSAKGHRFYFAAIAYAVPHWPSGAPPFQDRDETWIPTRADAELLRAWLQTKAGFHQRIDFPLEASDAVVKLIRSVASEERYSFVDARTIDGEQKLCVFIPDSIAYDEMDEVEFAPVRRPVFELIEQAIGVDVNTLVYEAENAV